MCVYELLAVKHGRPIIIYALLTSKCEGMHCAVAGFLQSVDLNSTNRLCVYNTRNTTSELLHLHIPRVVPCCGTTGTECWSCEFAYYG